MTEDVKVRLELKGRMDRVRVGEMAPDLDLDGVMAAVAEFVSKAGVGGTVLVNVWDDYGNPTITVEVPRPGDLHIFMGDLERLKDSVEGSDTALEILLERGPGSTTKVYLNPARHKRGAISEIDVTASRSL